MKLEGLPRRSVLRLGLILILATTAGALLVASLVISAQARPVQKVSMTSAGQSADHGARPAAAQPAAANATAGQASRGEDIQRVPRPDAAQNVSYRQGQAAQPLAQRADPLRTVRAAWEKARASGAYQFVTDVSQQVYPAIALESAGSGPDRDDMHLEGGVDLRAETLQVKLWYKGPGVAGGTTGAELRIENGVAYSRRLAGAPGSGVGAIESWQKAPDISGSFAPGGDALAFLAGIKNVAEIGAADTAAPEQYRRYSFDIDGPALAVYMRDRMEEQLRDRGKLPAGATLEMPEVYRNAAGHGEVWLDGAGLPVRLAAHLAFPEQRNGSRTEVDVQTDFSGYATPAAAPPLAENPVAWAGALAAAAQSSPEVAATGRILFALALGAASVALLLSGRRLRHMYVAVVVAVCLSMVFVPVLQAEQVASLHREQDAQLARQAKQAEAARAVEAALAEPAWNPNQDPLASKPASVPASAPQRGTLAPALQTTPEPTPSSESCDPGDTADRDEDGVNNYEECRRGLGTDLESDVDDTDSDGLLDGVEIYQLGTWVNDADSDGDYITDTLEVEGYLYTSKTGTKTWYLDPLNYDTDGDGIPDSGECPQLIDPKTYPPNTVMALCDTDQDGTPNPFDQDSDNDGVVDAVDLSAGSWVDHEGLRNQAFDPAALRPFDKENPFGLSLSGLEPGWPVFVDIQIRPQDAEHLAYSMSVLDWPAYTDGQMQHGKATTLADFQGSSDEASKHGDMRMVPMLEIEMDGTNIPLKLTAPTATFIVGEGTALSTTVTITSSASSNTTSVLIFNPAVSSLQVRNGTCDALQPQPVTTFTGASGTLTGTRVTQLADGNHAAVISSGSASFCTDFPNITNGSYLDKMVDPAPLEPYGISVNEASSTLLRMYVPLNLMGDDTGGGNPAFLAHILYWPGTGNPWSGIEQARFIWVIQALMDNCDSKDFPPTLADYQKTHKDADEDDYNAAYRAWCSTHRTADEMQVAHVYDESWYLTGLSVREDHGVQVSAAYENPESARNKPYPQPENDLWQLSSGLNSAFLTQRDCETGSAPNYYDSGTAASYDPATLTCSADGRRDVTVGKYSTSGTTVVGNSTIADRFDARSTSPIFASLTMTDRWQIPADALRVQTAHYEHQDRMTDIATKLVPAILTEFESKYGQSAGRAITPTILFAQEQFFRDGGLEAATWVAGTHSLSMNIGDESIYPEQLMTGMSWQRFWYDPTPDQTTGRAAGWQTMPEETALAQIQEQLTNYTEAEHEEETDSNSTVVMIGTSYYGSLYEGAYTWTNPCPTLSGSKCKETPPNSSVDLSKGVTSFGKGVWAVSMLVLDEMIGKMFRKEWQQLGSPDFPSTDELLKEKADGLWDLKRSGALSTFGFSKRWKTLAFASIIVGAVVVGALVCIGFILAKSGDATKISAFVLQGLGVIIAGLGVITAIGKAIRAAALGQGFLTITKNLQSAFKNLKGAFSVFKGIMTFVGLAVGLLMNAVSFIVQWFAGGLAKGSVTWTNALASMVASMIVTVIWFALTLIFGAFMGVVQAIIGLIDMVVGLICTAAGVTAQSNAMAYKWGCGGITGIVTNFFKILFFNGNVIVDMKDTERLKMNNFDLWFEDDSRPFEIDNSIFYSVDVTNTLKLAKIPGDQWYAMANSDQWSTSNLKRSTFSYDWTDNSEEKRHSGLDLGGEMSLWTATDPASEKSSVSYTKTVASSQGFLIEGPAGEYKPTLYLAEGYAVPYQKCWGDNCSIEPERNTSVFDLGKGLSFTVLDRAPEGFRALAAKGSGYGLAWGSGGLRFPALYDADNDGLPGTADADDSNADRDGDTLVDSFEVENGSSPALPDTDHDGMRDPDEYRMGTNPRLMDTDGDGLSDQEELDGWKFVYGFENGVAKSTWVLSDPLVADPDGDSLMDSKEKVYGYNPFVASSPNVLTLSSGLTEGASATSGSPSDGFVRPGQTFYYTATVKNELNSRWAQGLLQVTPQANLTTNKINPKEFVLYPQTTVTATGALAVSASAGGAYTVTQVAAALITDWEEIARSARLYLPFDDKTKLLGDRSASVPPHDAVCLAAGTGAPSTDCQLDPSGKYANAVKLTGTSYVRSDALAAKTGYAASMWFKTTAAGPLFKLESAAGAPSEAMVGLEGDAAFGWEVCGRIRTGQTCDKYGCRWNWDSICVKRNLLDNRWHHIAHMVGQVAGGNALQRLYVDGSLIGTGTVSQMAADPGAPNLGRSGLTEAWFTGSLDDFRLFDHALTAAEVRQLADQPVLSLNFDDTRGWMDVSSFNTPVSCGTGGTPANCPTFVSPGVTGSAAMQSGSTWLKTTGSGENLALGDGRVTLSAWIYPQNRGLSFYDNHAQGIIGYDSGETAGYPYLERVGLKVRFGFGSGTAPVSFTTSRDVLMLNAWNHVAATFDKDTGLARIYVNGRLAEENAQQFVGAAPPTGPMNIYIGRSTDQATYVAGNLNANSTGDGTCGAAFLGDYCFASNATGTWAQVWRTGTNHVGCDSSHDIPFETKFRFSTGVRLWENDGGTDCGSGPDSDDDHAQINRLGVWTELPVYYSWELADNAAESYDKAGNGNITHSVVNDSIPFTGVMDDVRVYNQALDEERIQRIYDESGLLMRLPFDDPPGTRAFSEASSIRAEVGCASCPTAGVAGRVDQAVLFNSTEKDYLTAANGPANRIAKTMTVAAWIRPNVVNDTYDTIIASTSRVKSDNGWFFKHAGNTVSLCLLGVSGVPCAASAYQTGVFQVGRWTHVAAALGSDGTVSFYIDGQLQYRDPEPIPVPAADNDDDLLIGAMWPPGASAPTGFFSGMIDDLRIYRTALSAGDIKAIYDDVPSMHLRFDETNDATAFADSARAGISGTCSNTACPATGEAVAGEIGLAAKFDGTDDLVTVAAESRLNPASFTVGAWIKPAGTMATEQRLVSKGTGTSVNYRLSIDANSLTPRLTTCGSYVTSTVPLVDGQWNQVLGTYDGQKLRLYLNGSESGVGNATGSCVASAPVYIGGDSTDKKLTLTGQLDEVKLYPVALRPWQIHDLFTYQNGWVEDRESNRVIVDNDSPVADVLLPLVTTYLPLRDAQIPITATDKTSGIASAVLCVDGTCGGAAPRCGESEAGLWCPTFHPGHGEGVYSLTAKATDLVKSTGATSAARTVRIDDTKPTVTFSTAAGQRLDATPDPARPNAWVVRLSGTASDPNSGVGLADDAVRVTVYDPNGGLAGPQRQVAQLNAGAWSLDYPLLESQPSGCYSAVIEASDQLANLADLDQTQLSHHRNTMTVGVGINSTAPSVQLERAGLSAASVMSGTTAIGGVATSRPVSVKVNWRTGAGGAGAAFSIVCSAPGTPSTYTVYRLPAGRMAADQDYSWGGEIQRGASCSAQVAASAGSHAVLSGTVGICSGAAQQWSDNGAATQSFTFSANSTTCPADSCSGTLASAGIGRVDVAYTLLMPGSVFLDEAPLPGEILRLPFEESADSVGPFRDASAGQRSATCAAGQCPAPGQVGHNGGAASFDGSQDVLRMDPLPGLTLATVSAWIRPTQATTTRETILSHRENNSCGFLLDLQSGTNGYPEFYIRYRTASNTVSWQKVVDQHAVALNQWTHIAGVYDGTYMYLYRDGKLVVKSGSMPGTIYEGCGGQLGIGARASLDTHYFPGLIDDVRVFDRALRAAEINKLYQGTGPVLQLGFESSWMANGASLADSSGWQSAGTLNAGAGDTANKATPGGVGKYALSFDGTDDSVALGDLETADGFGDFAVAQWFSIAALQAASTGRDYAAPIGKGRLSGATDGWAVVVDRDTTVANHKINLYFNGSLVATIPGPADGKGWQLGKWYHYAFTRGGSALRGFLDGAERMTPVTNSTLPVSNTVQLMLGKNEAGTYPWQGGLDDARIYRRGLSAQEIAELYNAGWKQAPLSPAGGAAVEATRWSGALPGGLEGSYRVDLRAWDAAGTPHVDRAPVASTADRASPTWSSDADSLAPRVTLCRAATSGVYTYTAVAQDFNLVEGSFKSPCDGLATATRDYFDSPWYVTAFAPGEKRVIGLSVACQTTTVAALEQARACDSAGNCATSSGLSSSCGTVTASALSAEAAQIAAPDARLPAQPVILFAPDTLTMTRFYPPRAIEVTGLVTGRPSVSGVQVAIGSQSGPATLAEPAATWPYTQPWSYTYNLPDGALPDAIVEAASAVATFRSGRTVAAGRDLAVDVVPPAEVNLALTIAGQVVSQGSTVRATMPELALSWTPSSDGSGVSGYQARWAVASAATSTVTARAHSANGPLEDRYIAGEAERVQVSLGTRDGYGNERWQEYGPVYVDGPRTPDYIDLGERGTASYDGWMKTGCSFLGRDTRNTVGSAAQYGRPEQQLYGTWNGVALRLAWTGANWNGQGDLFVYLDTKPDGGTRQVFAPFATPASGTRVLLPQTLDADYLVWAHSSDEARLLAWDGGTWREVRALTPEEFRFNPSRQGGQTDLYLPFDMLGLTPASSLALVAFATEEPVDGQALELWSVLPPANPVNSPRVSRWAKLVKEDIEFSLFRGYRWNALAADACPATSPANDIAVSMTSDPPGFSLSGLGNGLFWLSDPGLLTATNLGGKTAGQLAPRNPPLTDGQAVVYTAHYRNSGTHEAKGVRIELVPFGQVRLVDKVIPIGDIPPGGEGDVTFQAIADRSADTIPVAGVKALVYDSTQDSTSQALEWAWVAHRVDSGAPLRGRVELGKLIGASRSTFTGSVTDESGVREVTVEIRGPDGTQEMVCPVSRPLEGRWSCSWDPATKLPHGAQISVRARGTDSHGLVGEWSEPRVATVDAEPPELTLNERASGIASGGTTRGNDRTLYGTATDSGGVASVIVCVENEGSGSTDCGLAKLQGGDATTVRWTYVTPRVNGRDYAAQNITIFATDQAGNHTQQPLALQVQVDNVPPSLSVKNAQTQLMLGSTQLVLNGTVSDGSSAKGAKAVDVSVRAQPPSGAAYRADTSQSGASWRFDLAGSVPGHYVLWVDAKDMAGNLSSAGPFDVLVTCADAKVGAAVSAAPSPKGGNWLILKTVVRNAGPASIPAGLPLILYAPVETPGSAQPVMSPIASMTTTTALAAGGTETFTVDWSTPATGPVEISAAVAGEGVARAGGQPLCERPAPAVLPLALETTALYPGWNLVAPPVEPFDPAVATVQRPIAGAYAAILGYKGGLQVFNPALPNSATLAAIHATEGYWIRMPGSITPAPAGSEDWRGEPVVSWRLAGSPLPDETALPLSAGWNLSPYLPATTLPVTRALSSLETGYSSVLGFPGTAASFYPDLDSGYNTLSVLGPGTGLWISATRAITLQYPSWTEMPTTTLASGAQIAEQAQRLEQIRAAEVAAGAQPTYRWMNLYGPVYLPDGSPAPISTTVTALADGVACGAAVVTQLGRFGLLACYGDDETTAAADGARTGAGITLVVNGAAAQAYPVAFNGQPVTASPLLTWTATGDRWEVSIGKLPQAVRQFVDLGIAATIFPTTAQPGWPVTYTLAYSNAGNLAAQGVVITGRLPLELVNLQTSGGGGVTETETERTVTWQIGEVLPGASGLVTVTAVLSPATVERNAITSTVSIGGPAEDQVENNRVEVPLTVLNEPMALTPRAWLPVIVRP